MIFPSLVMNIKLISQPLIPLQLREGQRYVLFANSTYSPVDKNSKKRVIYFKLSYSAITIEFMISTLNSTLHDG